MQVGQLSEVKLRLLGRLSLFPAARLRLRVRLLGFRARLQRGGERGARGLLRDLGRAEGAARLLELEPRHVHLVGGRRAPLGSELERIARDRERRLGRCLCVGQLRVEAVEDLRRQARQEVLQLEL
eukprot:1049976-Prymnesium_polylepis.1